MELYAIRHGQSAANAIQAHAGWAQVPLTELGREQATKTGELLKGMEFDRVIVSDLLRAKETAQIALPGRNFEQDPRLRETNVGSLQGRRVVDLTAELGEEYVRRRLARDYRFYGGEDTHAHCDRVAEFMKDLESAPEDARIAAVCHEGTIMAMLCYVLHTDIPRNIIHVANCAVCAFKFGNGVWELGEWNETGSVKL